jgi:hypothetical protein
MHLSAYPTVHGMRVSTIKGRFYFLKLSTVNVAETELNICNCFVILTCGPERIVLVYLWGTVLAKIIKSNK